MGSLVGAQLARAGHDVTLTGGWREAVEAIAHRGITVEEGGQTWSAPVRAAPAAGALPRADLVLVLVKSYQTVAIAPTAARAAGPGTLLTLQNGLRNREALAAAGATSVLVGVTTAGATLLGPGHVRGHVARTVLGDDGAGRAQTVAELFRGAGLETDVAGDLERLLWRKLAVNCAINPLSALHGVENGALIENPEWRSQLEAAAKEAGAVARAKGIELGEDPVVLAVEVARATAANRSSMLQDLSRGARTEIDAISGAVVREAHALGLPAPVNQALWSAIRERETATAARLGEPA